MGGTWDGQVTHPPLLGLILPAHSFRKSDLTLLACTPALPGSGSGGGRLARKMLFSC